MDYWAYSGLYYELFTADAYYPRILWSCTTISSSFETHIEAYYMDGEAYTNADQFVWQIPVGSGSDGTPSTQALKPGEQSPAALSKFQALPAMVCYTHVVKIYAYILGDAKKRVILSFLTQSWKNSQIYTQLCFWSLIWKLKIKNWLNQHVSGLSIFETINWWATCIRIVLFSFTIMFNMSLFFSVKIVCLFA